MRKRTKRKVVTAFQRYALNPFAKLLPAPIGPAMIETTGRRSGRPRRTPVGVRFRDGAYWIVAEHGRAANYVRNIAADPNVRVRHRGRWHEGVAVLVDDEDPRSRAKGLNGLMVRLVGSDLLVIRIDPA